jgi:hypothetical protein
VFFHIAANLSLTLHIESFSNLKEGFVYAFGFPPVRSLLLLGIKADWKMSDAVTLGVDYVPTIAGNW